MKRKINWGLVIGILVSLLPLSVFAVPELKNHPFEIELAFITIIIGYLTFVSEKISEINSKVQTSEKDISKNIADRINADHSFFRIFLLGTEAGKYFENLSGLHRLLAGLNEKTNGDIFSKSLSVISKSTQYIEDFFKQNTVGGLYKVSDVVSLYESISSLVNDELTIIEPYEPPAHPSEKYDSNYIDRFLGITVKKIHSKKFIYRVSRKVHPDGFQNFYNNKTVTTLEKYHFKVHFYYDDDLNFKSPYLNYTHLVFKVKDHYISCSVRPTTKALDKAKLFELKEESNDFNKTEEVYLAFRVFRVYDNDEDNLIQLIRILKEK